MAKGTPLRVTLARLFQSGEQVLPTPTVRAVITSNIADLTSVTVASRDGLTLVEADRVLLVGQTTAAQNGIYVVGPVTAGSAALLRSADALTGHSIVNGRVVEVSEGTLFAGTTWKARCTGDCKWGTDDPLFYPRAIKATVTLVAGTKTLNSTQGLALLAGANVQITRNTANTSTATTGGYTAPAASRTVGKVGTASLVVNAEVAAGTLNNADVSSVDV